MTPGRSKKASWAELVTTVSAPHFTSWREALSVIEANRLDGDIRRGTRAATLVGTNPSLAPEREPDEGIVQPGPVPVDWAGGVVERQPPLQAQAGSLSLFHQLENLCWRENVDWLSICRQAGRVWGVLVIVGRNDQKAARSQDPCRLAEEGFDRYPVLDDAQTADGVKLSVRQSGFGDVAGQEMHRPSPDRSFVFQSHADQLRNAV